MTLDLMSRFINFFAIIFLVIGFKLGLFYSNIGTFLAIFAELLLWFSMYKSANQDFLNKEFDKYDW